MKILMCLLTAALTCGQAQASQETAVRAYITKAYSLYSQALNGARKTQTDINSFLADPTEDKLKIARNTWTEARKAYSQTEVYRFYGGPIDDENGPEGFINAWPLDEVYIDDIISQPNQYPALNEQSLRSLNEKDVEKNISTGWHAIEYMLWGKDLSATGPGARPASDYASSNPLAARRAQYLKAVAAALVTDLASVQVQWDINRRGSYAQKFAGSRDALTNMLTGVVKMSGAELSQERMFVALDTRSQEEEHSCFSDTTHFDIYYNFMGIKNVVTGVLDLIRAKDASVAAEIEDNLQVTEQAIGNMQKPFDQAIMNDRGRAGVMKVISSLESLTEAVRQGAVTIGVELP
jgi:putative iron-regulated protein